MASKSLSTTVDNGMQQLTTPSNFKFSGTTIDQLGASEYTIATIVLDASGSVGSFKPELEKCLKTILKSCKKSPRAENLMLRLVEFNDSVREKHGFRQLDTIDEKEYDNCVNPYGGTALYDAVLSSIEAVGVYGQQLKDQEFISNAVVYVLTDGMNNSGSATAKAIKKAIDKVRKDECLESIAVILLKVGAGDPEAAIALDAFAKDAEITQFEDLTTLFQKLSPEGALAKIAGFVSRSISSTSQSLANGSASPTSSKLTI